MTTEDEFQKALDADRFDWQLRQVFADWLQDRGDERAEGYRALGRRRMRPQSVVMSPDVPGARHDTQWVWGREDNPFATDPHYGRDVLRACLMPFYWFALLPYSVRVYSFNVDKEDRDWEHFPSRAEAEDAAALAFAKLPAKRRARLLSPSGASV